MEKASWRKLIGWLIGWIEDWLIGWIDWVGNWTGLIRCVADFLD
jgi:hypothetical protein